MQLNFKAKGTAPESYTISGEIINGLDLSVIQHGGQFIGSETTRQAGIYGAYRDAQGELFVTLGQTAPPGHWRGNPDLWVDADDYDPEAAYIRRTDEQGNPVDQEETTND